jgi:hypothetical protein
MDILEEAKQLALEKEEGKTVIYTSSGAPSTRRLFEEYAFA